MNGEGSLISELNLDCIVLSQEGNSFGNCDANINLSSIPLENSLNLCNNADPLLSSDTVMNSVRIEHCTVPTPIDTDNLNGAVLLTDTMISTKGGTIKNTRFLHDLPAIVQEKESQTSTTAPQEIVRITHVKANENAKAAENEDFKYSNISIKKESELKLNPFHDITNKQNVCNSISIYCGLITIS